MTRRRLTPVEAQRIARDYGAACRPGHPVQILPKGQCACDPARRETPGEVGRRSRRIFARKRKFEALARREQAQ